jgi:hypothetical protein
MSALMVMLLLAAVGEPGSLPLAAVRDHTVAVAPESHRAYFPLENLRGRAVLRVMRPR